MTHLLADLARSSVLSAVSAAAVLAQTPAESQDLGGGTPGTLGVPRVAIEGAPAVGSPLGVRIDRARPGSVAWCGVGLSQAPFFEPFLGATFHPAPPFALIALLPVGGAGRTQRLVSAMPVAPSLIGIEFWVQGVVGDPVSPTGVAVSQARRVRIGSPLRGDLFRFEIHAADEWPVLLDTAELDGDGDPDVVLAYGGGSFEVLHGRPGMLFESKGTVSNSIAEPTDSAFADFDGDGELDYLVVGRSPDGVAPGGIAVHLGLGDGTFGPALEVAGGPAVDDVAFGDLDGDGVLDLAAVDESGDLLRIFLGNGDGTFGASLDTVVTLSPADVVIADLVDDAALDVVVVRRWSSEDLVFAGQGDGTLVLHQSMGPLLDGRHTAAVGDVDGDGFLDVVVGDGEGVYTYAGTGSGDLVSTGFEYLHLEIIPYEWDFNLLDVNADGAPDLFIEGFNPDNSGLNDGAGSFWSNIGFSEQAQASDHQRVTADFDGDGDLDLGLVFIRGGFLPLELENLAQVQISSGSGGFPSFGPGFVGFTSFDVGDFDLDGRDDAVLRYPHDGTARVARSNLDGTLTNDASLDTGPHAEGSAVVDLDQDGKPEYVVATATPSLRVFEGDGTVGFGAFVSLPLAFQPSGLGVGDFDGDGVPDLATTDRVGQAVAVLLGDGLGGFAAPVLTPLDHDPSTFAAGDMDGDGFDDLVTGVAGDARVTIQLSNGDGTFTKSQEFACGVGVDQVEAVDLSNDDLLDLVVRGADDPAPTGVAVILATGPTSYGAPNLFPAIVDPVADARPTHFVVDHVDGDLELDVFVTHLDGLRTRHFAGRGDGTFDPPRVFKFLRSGNRNVSLLDVTGDGYPEAIESSRFAVLENRIFEIVD